MNYNHDKIVNRVFKILCIYENDIDNYESYLETIIVELAGYSVDQHFTNKQQEILNESLNAIKGLRKLNDTNSMYHKMVRKTILRYVNRLSTVLKDGEE